MCLGKKLRPFPWRYLYVMVYDTTLCFPEEPSDEQQGLSLSLYAFKCYGHKNLSVESQKIEHFVEPQGSIMKHPPPSQQITRRWHYPSPRPLRASSNLVPSASRVLTWRHANRSVIRITRHLWIWILWVEGELDISAAARQRVKLLLFQPSKSKTCVLKTGTILFEAKLGSVTSDSCKDWTTCDGCLSTD